MTESRHLAAIMFADIAGYTALMQQDEQKALELINRFKEVLEDITPGFQGKIVQYFGDGCLMAFDSSVKCAECAMALQNSFRKTPHVPVRIGLHLGDVIFRNENVFGDGVNIASRIESLGIPGAILLSKPIRDQVKNKAAFELTSLGSFDFKNVEEPMEVFAISNPGFVVPRPQEMSGKLKEKIKNKSASLKKWMIAASAVLLLLIAAFFIRDQLSGKKTEPSKEKSVAVLYFDNMSGDPEQEYFSDGITEEIIAHLSKIKGIRVISRTSVLPYKGKPHNLKTIGKELNVDAILEGSVRKSGNVFRVTGQLIDAFTDKHLWAETFDRNIENIFEVQSDIARNIAKKFEIEISPQAGAKISQIPTQNIEAYQQFQKGRFFLYKKYFNSHLDEDFQKSKKFFEQAIQQDSGYAEAYAGLAEVYDEWRNWDEVYSLKNKTPKKFTKELYELKEILARKALQLKPNSSFANTAMAWMLMHRPESNFDSAFYYLKKAYYLDPTDPLNSYNLGEVLHTNLGLHEAALPFLLQAVKADPLDPNVYVHLGQVQGALGHFTEARKAFNTCYELTDENFQQEFRLVFWLIQLGELDKAKKRIDLRKGANKWVESYYYAVKGEPDKVNPDFKDSPLILLATNRNKILKDVVKKLESLLDEGISDGLCSYDILNNSPDFDAYREDPDFKRTVAKAKKLQEAKMLKYGNIEIPE